ncbi:MAG: hypothetical protein CMJ93_02695 [Planctomycetes bacterium]|nr:hypothetical protein [Planctomycetota bacterium]
MPLDWQEDLHAAGMPQLIEPDVLKRAVHDGLNHPCRQYETIMPMVRAQVESQIRVRDLSKTSVSIAPADYSSWQVALDSMLLPGM